MKIELARQSSEKSTNVKFHENPFIGAELFRPDGRTDGREANSRFSQFCFYA